MEYSGTNQEREKFPSPIFGESRHLFQTNFKKPFERISFSNKCLMSHFKVLPDNIWLSPKHFESAFSLKLRVKTYVDGYHCMSNNWALI